MEETNEAAVFIVYGHDTATLREVQVFVGGIVMGEVTVLMDEAHGGQTLIEKFEKEAGDTSFVVALLTADDEGRALQGADDLHPRARQNVILELGYFMGKLSRQRVAILVDPKIERPSDINGMGYIELSGNWQSGLRRELASAGVSLRAGT